MMLAAAPFIITATGVDLDLVSSATRSGGAGTSDIDFGHFSGQIVIE